MKGVLLLFVFLNAFTLSGKNSEPEIIEIRIKFQSSFSPLPEDYIIKMMERKVVYTSLLAPLPDGKPKVKTKKFRGKKWEELTALIDELESNSLNSSTVQRTDGGSYSLSILYSNNGAKELKMWTGYTSDELLEIHQLIKLKKYK